MIAVIDYKAGNLTSVVKALSHLGAQARVTGEPAVVARAERIVLPGVGHFAATACLHERGLASAVREAVDRGVPFLGICVGMQWLFEGSAEAPEVPGLGLLKGRCERFPSTVKAPHVGWNSVEVEPASRLMHGVPTGSFVYYTHSYRAPACPATVAETEYGGPFSGAVERANVVGVQFHPEKSSDAGLRILRNFLALPGGIRRPGSEHPEETGVNDAAPL